MAHPAARDDHRAQLAGAARMLDPARPGRPPRLPLNCAAALKPLCRRVNEAAGAVFQALVDREAHAQLLGSPPTWRPSASGTRR